ncbi:KilA-like protein [Beggiatoa sp. PS]|nr:KilA-like protein [Beggiatoa sp. PS]
MSNQMIVRDFHGNAINQRASDGYFDATAMCRAAGKRIDNYWRLDGTQEFLSALSDNTGFPIKSSGSAFPQKSVTEQNQVLIQIIQGGNPENQGTWIHPQVSVNLAQWCSPQFAVQVSEWVFELMTTGKTELPGYRSEIDYAVMAKITTTARKTYSGLGLTGKALNKAVRTALIEKTGVDLLAGIVKDEIIDDELSVVVKDYLEGKQETTITMIVDDLKLKTDKLTRNRIANILRHEDWQSSTYVYVDGKRKRGWRRLSTYLL